MSWDPGKRKAQRHEPHRWAASEQALEGKCQGLARGAGRALQPSPPPPRLSYASACHHLQKRALWEADTEAGKEVNYFCPTGET